MSARDAGVKTAIIYARVSSKQQKEAEIPVASQLEASRAKASQLGLKVLREFVDGGKSGRAVDGRHEFLAAIEYCNLAGVDFFITWDTKRFARNKLDAALRKDELRRGGTEMLYVSQQIDTRTDDGWFMEGLCELLDERESRRISVDTKRSLMMNARAGFWNGGHVPYGYAVVPDGKRRRLAILEDEAVVVRKIFAEYLAGSGLKSIVLWLNGAGISRRGQPWSKNTLNNLLRNPVYCGYITFNRMNNATGEVRPEEDWVSVQAHPRIIEEDVMSKVLQLMSERAPERGSSSSTSGFLFTGILRCGKCDAAMQIQTGKGRGGKLYSYYRCGANLRSGACSKRMIPAADCDGWIRDVLLSRVLTRDRLEELAREVHDIGGRWIKERAAQREVLVRELRDAEMRRSNLYGVLEHHGKDAPNLGDLSPRLRELNQQIARLDRSLTELELQPVPPAAAEIVVDQVEEFVRTTLEHGDPAKVRQFFGSFVEKVVLEADQLVIHYHPGRLVAASPAEAVRSPRKWLPELGSLRTATVWMPEKYRRAA